MASVPFIVLPGVLLDFDTAFILALTVVNTVFIPTPYSKPVSKYSTTSAHEIVQTLCQTCGVGCDVG
jgi:hypothetical protein